MKTYTISHALKVMIVVLAALAAVAAGWGIYAFSTGQHSDLWLLGGCVAVYPVIILVLMYVFSLRLTITADSIRKQSMFLDQELPFTKISGYFMTVYRGEVTFNLAPTGSEKGISIGSGWEEFVEIESMIRARFIDLEKLERHRELKRLARGHAAKPVRQQLKEVRRVLVAMKYIRPPSWKKSGWSEKGCLTRYGWMTGNPGQRVKQTVSRKIFLTG